MEKIAFSGTSAVGYLDDELRVKIQFAKNDAEDCYNGLHVKIINRTEGVIDEETFRFKDIIGMKQDREGEHEPTIQIKGDELRWRTIPLVVEKNQIADTVLSYVSVYQDPNMVLTGVCSLR